jgi:hypothetical protein
MHSFGASGKTYRPFPVLLACSGKYWDPAMRRCRAILLKYQSSDQICKDTMNRTVAGYAGGEGIASSATLAVE